jgi:hypothetical protein
LGKPPTPERGRKIPRFTDNFDRTIHLLDKNGFIRDWLITKAWITPAEDLGKLLKDSGDPFGKDGRWVLTNGPDIAPLKAKIFKNRPFIADQSCHVLLKVAKCHGRHLAAEK